MADVREHRSDAVLAALREREVQALLVSAPANVRYLTGYTGSNGVAVLASDAKRAAAWFFTDFRYETQAAEEVAPRYARETAPVDLLGAVAETLRGTALAGANDEPPRLGFDENHLTVAQHERLSGFFEGEWSLVACGGLVEALREVKDDEELRRIEAATRLADEALAEVLAAGFAGRTEREVAIDLESRMRRMGAEAPSFPTIVAAGAHAALPHAQPRDVRIAAGELVTIDWGAIHEGYCSDCTRTFACGPPSERQREIYEVVLAAQDAGLAALRPERTGKEVDASAREVIEDAGYGACFGHGLGHGVGIEVHEGPRLSRLRAEAPLRAGNVVTVEPGVYLPGELGVRVEELTVVTADASRVLTSLPRELTSVD
jgi:Xaa-Pro aminopeptidase